MWKSAHPCSNKHFSLCRRFLSLDGLLVFLTMWFGWWPGTSPTCKKNPSVCEVCVWACAWCLLRTSPLNLLVCQVRWTKGRSGEEHLKLNRETLTFPNMCEEERGTESNNSKTTRHTFHPAVSLWLCQGLFYFPFPSFCSVHFTHLFNLIFCSLVLQDLMELYTVNNVDKTSLRMFALAKRLLVQTALRCKSTPKPGHIIWTTQILSGTVALLTDFHRRSKMWGCWRSKIKKQKIRANLCTKHC